MEVPYVTNLDYRIMVFIGFNLGPKFKSQIPKGEIEFVSKTEQCIRIGFSG